MPMTTTDFTTNSDSIVFYNSAMGKETIVVNGKKVSEKYSFFGTRHEFTIDDDNYEVVTSFIINSTIGVKAQLRKNGRLIEEKTNGESLLHTVIGLIAILFFVRLLFWIL